MNRSGAAVAALLTLAEAGPEDLLVVCDDLNLEFGTIRLRSRGSHGGHKGLLSIIETLGTQGFARLRLGVGPADCAETAVLLGVTAAMNRFNAPSRAGAAEGPV